MVGIYLFSRTVSSILAYILFLHLKIKVELIFNLITASVVDYSLWIILTYSVSIKCCTINLFLICQMRRGRMSWSGKWWSYSWGDSHLGHILQDGQGEQVVSWHAVLPCLTSFITGSESSSKDQRVTQLWTLALHNDRNELRNRNIACAARLLPTLVLQHSNSHTGSSNKVSTWVN